MQSKNCSSESPILVNRQIILGFFSARHWRRFPSMNINIQPIVCLSLAGKFPITGSPSQPSDAPVCLLAMVNVRTTRFGPHPTPLSSAISFGVAFFHLIWDHPVARGVYHRVDQCQRPCRTSPKTSLEAVLGTWTFPFCVAQSRCVTTVRLAGGTAQSPFTLACGRVPSIFAWVVDSRECPRVSASLKTPLVPPLLDFPSLQMP